MGDVVTGILWSLLPTVVVLGLFLFTIRGMLRMDRTERATHARIEAEERARRGLPPRETQGPGPAPLR